MNQPITHIVTRGQSLLSSLTRHLGDAGPLLLRSTVGLMFARTGWGKIQNMERTIGYFDSLGIPAAEFQAPMVANVELLGGILLVLGLATRFASIPLSVTMVVAILTAHSSEVSGVLDLLSLDASIYLAALLTLVVQGPGKMSIDELIRGHFARGSNAGSARNSSNSFA